MSDIQFGVNFHAAADAADFERIVRRADELGFDVLAAPDHLGAMGPFTLLAAAATISRRLRLRTYVLNVGFWNPALLAREVATLDVVSGGRAELGIGAGHTKSEHDDAGLPWLAFAQRIELAGVNGHRGQAQARGPGARPAAVQQPVPLMIAAMSGVGLAVAARHAEVIGFAGLRQVRGRVARHLHPGFGDGDRRAGRGGARTGRRARRTGLTCCSSTWRSDLARASPPLTWRRSCPG